MVASRGGYRMARGRHYAKLSLSNAALLSFSGLCILLFLFLSLCRLCCCCCCCCFLTLTDPLRIQPWSQDRRNQTKSNRESEMSMESIQKRTGMCLCFSLLSLELGRCSSDLFLSSRPRTGLATTCITGYG